MTDKYIYAIGRRKTSSVTLRLFQKSGKNIINGKNLEEVYVNDYEVSKILSPFETINLDSQKFYFTVVAKGGGKYSQMDAVILALSRALTKLNSDNKKTLKDKGLLTRDPRMVERKKTGLRKARKAEQYSKR